MDLKPILTYLSLTIVSNIVGVGCRPSTCIEPVDLQRRLDRINNGFDYRTLFLISQNWDEKTIEVSFKDLVFQGFDKSHVTCPSTFYKGNFPLMIRSSCPWYLEKTYDDERFPKELYNAKSKCLSCIGSNGLQKCERIYRQIKTLRRSGCIDGIYQYKEQDEMIPVAFACAQQTEVEYSNYSK